MDDVRNLMKTIAFITGFALMALLLPVLAFPASLQWDDPGAEWSDLIGYTVYFTDGTENFNKSVPVSDLVRAEGVSVTYPDIDDKLNLHYNIEYTFYITAYNDTAESGPSNSVTYTREGYMPPPDRLPSPVASSPQSATGLGIN